MAKSNNLSVLLALLAITAAVVPNIEAADHVVGDSSGWIVPGSSSFYSEWAAKLTLAVGDNLVFNFVTGAHTVARTTKAGYDSCDLNAATNTMSTAPAKVTLDAAGDYYFICTVPGHCAAGQKLAVNVGASSAVPSPAPTGSSAAPPPTSEAPSAATPEASPAPIEAPSAATPEASPAPIEAPSATTPASSEAPSAATPEASSSPPSGSIIPTPEASPSPGGSENPMAEAPSSSSSSVVATFSLGLMSAAVALFY